MIKVKRDIECIPSSIASTTTSNSVQPMKRASDGSRTKAQMQMHGVSTILRNLRVSTVCVCVCVFAKKRTPADIRVFQESRLNKAWMERNRASDLGISAKINSGSFYLTEIRLCVYATLRSNLYPKNSSRNGAVFLLLLFSLSLTALISILARSLSLTVLLVSV